MNASNTCLTLAALLLCLSYGLAFRLDWTVPNAWLSPPARYSWGLPPPSEWQHTSPSKLPVAMGRNAGNDVSPDKAVLSSVELSKKSADSDFKEWLDSAGTEQMKSGDVHGFDIPGELQEDDPKNQAKKAETELLKQTFDKADRSLVKKYLNNKDVKQRQVQPFEMDMVKQLFSEPGMGLDKNPFPYSDADLQKHPVIKNEKGLVEVTEQNVNTGSIHNPNEKQAALELIKKGLDAIGTGLIKKGLDTVGSGLIKRGLTQLADSLGNGDPTKEVDIDMFEGGLDSVGAGMFTQGLDTAGLKLIKRGMDKIEAGLVGSSSDANRQLDSGGISLMKTGFDHLETGLVKHGVDMDGLGMITEGLEKLGKWLIKQGSDHESYDVVKATGDKKTDTTKETFADYKLIKKGFDKLVAELNTKASDDGEPGIVKTDFNQDEMEFIKKKLHGVGAGLIKKDLDDVGAGLIEKDLDDVGAGLIKKDLDDVGAGLIKKDLDGVGAGLIKKDLDGVGAGLIKKDLDDTDKEILRKKLDSWGPVHKKRSEDSPEHPDVKSAFNRKEPNDEFAELANKFSDDLNSKSKEKEPDDVNMAVTKKGSDDAGTGLVKKELDDVGSGLLKKESENKGFDLDKNGPSALKPHHFDKNPPSALKLHHFEEKPSKEKSHLQTQAPSDDKSKMALKEK